MLTPHCFVAIHTCTVLWEICLHLLLRSVGSGLVLLMNAMYACTSTSLFRDTAPEALPTVKPAPTERSSIPLPTWLVDFSLMMYGIKCLYAQEIDWSFTVAGIRAFSCMMQLQWVDPFRGCLSYSSATVKTSKDRSMCKITTNRIKSCLACTIGHTCIYYTWAHANTWLLFLCEAKVS